MFAHSCVHYTRAVYSHRCRLYVHQPKAKVHPFRGRTLWFSNYQVDRLLSLSSVYLATSLASCVQEHGFLSMLMDKDGIRFGQMVLKYKLVRSDSYNFGRMNKIDFWWIVQIRVVHGIFFFQCWRHLVRIMQGFSGNWWKLYANILCENILRFRKKVDHFIVYINWRMLKKNSINEKPIYCLFDKIIKNNKKINVNFNKNCLMFRNLEI